MGRAYREHEQHQGEQAADHERTAAVRDQAARMHQDAAEFFNQYDKPGKAEREHELVKPEEEQAARARDQAAVDQYE